MRTPADKLKKADKNLVAVSLFCLGMGLMLVWFCLRTYFKHDFEFLDADKPVSLAVSRPLIKAVKAITYVLLPVLASGYFLAAYSIWSYRHRRGKLTPNTALEPTAAAASVSSTPSNPKAGDDSTSVSSGGGSALDR